MNNKIKNINENIENIENVVDNNEIVTRFAPSPTGNPHIGSLLIAVVNYIFSKKNNGKFLLRIEDTDRERSKEEYEKEIIDMLLNFNIVPDNLSNYPRQSERKEIYLEYARKLESIGFVKRTYASEKLISLLKTAIQFAYIYLNKKYDNFIYNKPYSDWKKLYSNNIEEMYNNILRETNSPNIATEITIILYISEKTESSILLDVNYILNKLKSYFSSVDIDRVILKYTKQYTIPIKMRLNDLIYNEQALRDIINANDFDEYEMLSGDPCYIFTPIPTKYLNRPEFHTEFVPYFRKLFNLSENEAPKIKFHDLIYGEMALDIRNMHDIVILRSDGTPTYNFACVIDDYLMNITHVIRGADHIPNTFYQIYMMKLLFNKELKYTHIPLVLDKNGRKLSKRDNLSNIKYLTEKYTPKSILISLISKLPKDGNDLIKLLNLMKDKNIINDIDVNVIISKIREKISTKKEIKFCSNKILKQVLLEMGVNISSNYIRKLRNELNVKSDILDYDFELSKISKKPLKIDEKYINFVNKELNRRGL